jgi:GTP-binding protein
LLNRWLRAITVLKPPPTVNGKRYNLKYITQTNIRPPTFSVFCGRKREFPEDYRRFLITAIKEEFGLHGIPVRLHVRASKNPYAPSKNTLSRSEERKLRQQRGHEKRAGQK